MTHKGQVRTKKVKTMQMIHEKRQSFDDFDRHGRAFGRSRADAFDQVANDSPQRWPFELLDTLFCLKCLFIAGVSLFDAWLIAVHADLITETEQNPIGKYLLEIGNGDITLFVIAKAVGTLVVLTALIALWKFLRPIAFPVVNGITSIQVWLLWYLTCFTNQMTELLPEISTVFTALVISSTLCPMITSDRRQSYRYRYTFAE